MRKWSIVLLVSITVLFAGAGVLLSADDEPDGLPDISGTWVGKAKIKGYDMTGDGDHEKMKVPVTIEILQEGNEIHAQITPEDGSPFEMEGLIGDGHFWLASVEDGEVALWVGHVKSKGKKIKGTFLSGEDDYVFEMGIQLKRPK